jgi:hypothetical protein
MDLAALPCELMSIIVDNIVSSGTNNAPKVLDRLEALDGTCKEYHEIVKDKFATLYESLSVSKSRFKDDIMTRRGISYKDRCRRMSELQGRSHHKDPLAVSGKALFHVHL